MYFGFPLHRQLSQQIFLFFIIVFAFFLAETLVQAASKGAIPSVTLNPAQERYDVGKQATVLADPEGRLTIGKVLQLDAQGAFAPNSSELIDHGGGDASVWARLNLRPSDNLRKTREQWILEIVNSDWSLIELFVPDAAAPDGYRRIDGRMLGRMQPEAALHRNFTYLLPKLSGTSNVFYIRLEATGPTSFPLIIWRADSFQKHTLLDFFSFGLVYGIILSMILYNFFIYLSLQNKVYRTYVLYMLSFLCYLLVLNGHLAVLSGNPGTHWMPLEWFFLGCSIMLVAKFGQQFLNTKPNTPRLHRGLNLFHGLGLLIILFGAAGCYDEAAITAYVAGASGPTFVCIIAAVRWRQGFTSARFYILANIFFLIGTLSFILWSMGLFPALVTGNLLLSLGPAADAVLLSFALADRIRQLRQEKMSLVQSQAHYKKISETDGLTGLYNKRELAHRLGQEIDHALESERPLSLLIMDVDNFKMFNDTYGHPEGDVVLQALAAVIKKEIRESDAAFRYGGEEFVALFPNAGIEQSLRAAERIRNTFACQLFTPNGNDEISVTASLGLAQFRENEPLESFIRRADQALYDAKHQGKNKVVVAD